MFLTESCTIRIEPSIAYFYSFDEESSCRYVQVSRNRLEHTVDEYHYKEDKYDGDIEININIPNEINGVPVTSMGGCSYKIDNENNHEHDNSKFCNVASNMTFSIIANDFFDVNCCLTINIFIPKNVQNLLLSTQEFIMYNNNAYIKEFVSYENVLIKFYVDEKNENYYSKEGILSNKNSKFNRGGGYIFSCMKGNLVKKI